MSLIFTNKSWPRWLSLNLCLMICNSDGTSFGGKLTNGRRHFFFSFLLLLRDPSKYKDKTLTAFLSKYLFLCILLFSQGNFNILCLTYLTGMAFDLIKNCLSAGDNGLHILQRRTLSVCDAGKSWTEQNVRDEAVFHMVGFSYSVGNIPRYYVSELCGQTSSQASIWTRQREQR